MTRKTDYDLEGSASSLLTPLNDAIAEIERRRTDKNLMRCNKISFTSL